MKLTNDVDVKDIEIGQEWLHVATYVIHRRVWKVVEKNDDHVVLERGRKRQRQSFGHFLSAWCLVLEEGA